MVFGMNLQSTNIKCRVPLKFSYLRVNKLQNVVCLFVFVLFWFCFFFSI